MQRKKKLFILPLFLLLLSSCNGLSSSTSDTQAPSSTTSEDSITSSESEGSPTTSGNGESEVSEESVESSFISSEPSSDSEPPSGTEILDFYAVNDLHGALHARPDFREPGLAKLGAYLKNKKAENPDNTVIISTGDMWQGTFEAYHSKGRVVTHAMNDIGFDLMAIGNHEFDWGPEYILDNVAVANFPFLGANIMKYPEVTEKSPIGEEYVILERGNVKIGVIGVIGQEQMTSICSSLIEEIYFENHVPVIERLSTKLRDEENVDIVILAIHAGHADVPDFLAVDKYVDAVFNAHTHRYEDKIIAGVPFIQGGSKGSYISHIQLAYDHGTKSVTTLNYENINMRTYDILPDESVQMILDDFKAESDVVSSQYVGTGTQQFENNKELPRILNYAIARRAEELNYELDYVFNDSTRENLPGGDVTYGDLYKAHPFDNETYIVKVFGRNLLAQKQYYQFYRAKDHTFIDNDSFYTLAIQDYKILHQDITKTYNYFPGYNPERDFIGIITDENGATFLPRDLIAREFYLNPDYPLNPWAEEYHNSRHYDFLVP